MTWTHRGNCPKSDSCEKIHRPEMQGAKGNRKARAKGKVKAKENAHEVRSKSSFKTPYRQIVKELPDVLAQQIDQNAELIQAAGKIRYPV